MISERLEAARKRLAATSNSRVYTVSRVSPTEIVVLLVPKGSENLDTCNLDGGPPPDDGEGEWGRIDRPTLVSIDEAYLPAESPVRLVTSEP
jgi:hypothetical protein